MDDDPFANSAWARIVLHGRAAGGLRVVLAGPGPSPDGPVPEWASDEIDAAFRALWGGPVKFSSDVAAAIVAASTRFGVEAAFLAAIVMQESSGDTWAMRYEPAYNYLWDVEANKPFRGVMNPQTFPAPDGVSSQTEWMSQKTSFGCCQILGAVARELCYPNKYLTSLCDPDVGVEYGARLIARIMTSHKDPAEIASVYNSGHVAGDLANDPYVTSVAKYHQQFSQSGF